MKQARLTLHSVRHYGVAAFIAMSLASASSSQAATMRFDNGGGTGTWEVAANWDETAAPDTLPGVADQAEISNSHTVSISSAQTVAETILAHPNSAPATTAGVATLNVLAGTNLQTQGSAGFRVGRLLKGGELLGSSKGVVMQSGGLVQINGSTQGLRLSAGDSGNVADSYYRISGGSLVATGGSNAIQIGNLASNYGVAELHVYGSGATEIHTDYFRIQDSPTGTTRLHMSLDAGGVTPILADDEFQFRGTNNNELLIDLIGLAPTTDITLATADRLGNNSGAVENFFGLPDGAPISASFGPLREQYTYNWTIDYQDASDNGVIDAYIILRFQSRTLSVPEPGSLVLVSICGVVLALWRRRGL
jgi:hypothetical protein